jgi:maleate cis-trans isomerase
MENPLKLVVVMVNSSIAGVFSIAMLDYQRVTIINPYERNIRVLIYCLAVTSGEL